MTKNTHELRQQHRKYRAGLEGHVLAGNAAKLKSRIEQLPEYQRSTDIAAYIAIRGEIDLKQLIEAGTANGKRFYLPVLDESSMRFAHYDPSRPLVKRGFGLLEPEADNDDFIDPSMLDLVLTPLVVFDAKCNRIGQGGGFYDRTFAHKQNLPDSAPLLLGVAHESQREELLTPESWDIPLNLIATELSLYRRADENK